MKEMDQHDPFPGWENAAAGFVMLLVFALVAAILSVLGII